MKQNVFAIHMEVGQLPRNWEHAFGYQGEARYVGFYWEPADDEAVYTDGRSRGCGNWDLFLRLNEESLPCIFGFVNLGYSDMEPVEPVDADHWLVLERDTRVVTILPRDEARAKIIAQWPQVEADNQMASPEGYLETLARAWAQVVERGGREGNRVRPCPDCRQNRALVPGWLLAEDGSFNRCQACSGHGFVAVVEN